MFENTIAILEKERDLVIYGLHVHPEYLRDEINKAISILWKAGEK